ncbi:hypothetical protein [uncultured Clostridium sp.]|uniref:hypothetical protein n=1 Tax=uncultured Clostridium sp. TaxID=59620 RepID=UPI002629B068|nr:hypothetical protein [uncultured Clostridium sp.]
MKTDLLSSTSRVEAPFIIAKIAGYSFGLFNKVNKTVYSNSGAHKAIITDYPNYMQSLDVTKINGTVNTYTLVMVYAIREGDDPNLLEKIFSKAKNDRKMILTYGDCSMPSFIYKEEETLITDIKSSFNLSSSSITYTISAVSQAVSLCAGTFNFDARKCKPSDRIKEILYNNKYGLLQIFNGMKDKDKVLTKGLIASDDISVQLERKTNINILSYFQYLISCMRSSNDDLSSVKKNSFYNLVVVDDVSGEFNGTYFRIDKITNNLSNINSLDTYEIDIGYQGANIVTSFTIDDNQTYSILYDYSGNINQSQYIHRINDNGELESIYSPNITKSNELLKTTEAEKTW